MPGTPGESTSSSKGPGGARLLIWAGVVIVVFLAGLGAGVLLEQSTLPFVQVTPVVDLIGPASNNLSLSSSCAGVTESSFNGYFHCSVGLWCRSVGGGAYTIANASAPGAASLIVTPPLPHALVCPATENLELAGLLGYSGTVWIYLDAF